MKTNNQQYNFSIIHRLLHWAIAFTILFILLTVFLRMGWMNKTNVANIITDNLQLENITIPSEKAESIAKKIRKPMWDWHMYIGYTLIGLYIVKLVHMFIKRVKVKNTFNPTLTLKQKAQSWIYLLFYVILGITLVTGVILDQHFLKEYRSIIKELHIFSLYFMLLFLLFHLCGIFIGEKTSEKGIVSSMINGGKL